MSLSHYIKTDLETFRDLEKIGEKEAVCAGEHCSQTLPMVTFKLEDGTRLVFTKDIDRIVKYHE